jgi:N-methylhydantoinase B
VSSETTVSVLGDRVDYVPFGICGGGKAAGNKVEFETHGKTWKPELRSKQEKEEFVRGDSLRVGSPGGGGYGNAFERDVAAVERDLNLGYVSQASAESLYGVVIAEAKPLGAGHTHFRVDVGATAQHRRQLTRA